MWIPNIVEEMGEDTIQEAIGIFKKKLDIKKLAQEIFDVEKKENIL